MLRKLLSKTIIIITCSKTKQSLYLILKIAQTSRRVVFAFLIIIITHVQHTPRHFHPVKGSKKKGKQNKSERTVPPKITNFKNRTYHISSTIKKRTSSCSNSSSIAVTVRVPQRSEKKKTKQITKVPFQSQTLIKKF